MSKYNYLAVLLAVTGCLSGCSMISNDAVQSNRQSTTPTSSTTLTAPDVVHDDKSLRISLTQAQKQEVGVTAAEVKTGSIYKTVESPGRVQPNAELSTLVSTPSPGRVLEVKARLGEIVQPGQIMAIIKSDAIGQVQSDLLQNALQAKADIKQQEVQLKLSKVTFERESILLQEQVSAKADFQAAENQLEKDEANLAALKSKLDATIRTAQERLTLLGAPPDSAQKVVSQKKIEPRVVIRAPRAGLVIDRSVNPGELSDGTKPLFTLANLSQVWLVADIFEKDVESVKKGQEARVSVDSLPGHSFPAKIVWVGDSINPTTRTLPVRADVPNPDLLLKPGMFARIAVSVGRVPVALVPCSAVIQKGDKELVFVDRGDGAYQQREVKSGIADGDNIEIRNGLKVGERVVTRGSISLLGALMKTSEGKAD